MQVPLLCIQPSLFQAFASTADTNPFYARYALSPPLFFLRLRRRSPINKWQRRSGFENRPRTKFLSPTLAKLAKHKYLNAYKIVVQTKVRENLSFAFNLCWTSFKGVILSKPRTRGRWLAFHRLFLSSLNVMTFKSALGWTLFNRGKKSLLFPINNFIIAKVSIL